MTTNDEALKNILAQMEERDSKMDANKQSLTQDQLNFAESEAHLALDIDLSMAIIEDIRESIGNGSGWSLVLCGARTLRSGLENDHSLLNELKSTHSELLNELVSDVVRVGFSDSSFKVATQTELRTLCSLFK